MMYIDKTVWWHVPTILAQIIWLINTLNLIIKISLLCL